MTWHWFAMTSILLASSGVAQAQQHPGQSAHNRAPQHASGAGQFTRNSSIRRITKPKCGTSGTRSRCF